ncbi:hypothetical protein DV737_g4081, partial [Chaetothyriales sp. CBS 132003]
MQDMTEPEMWRLIRGRTCQFCGKNPKARAPPDSELFLSNSSVLIPGLPFAGFTPSLNYVTSATLRHSQLPPNLSLAKYYFRPQIQALESTVAEVRALGEGALAEWYRGLEKNGQSQMADAARFEHWEASVMAQVHLDSAPAHRIDASESTSSKTSPAHSMTSSAVHSTQWSMASPNPFTVSTPQYLGGQPASVFGSSTPSHIPFQSLSMLASQQSPQRKPFQVGSFSPMSVGSQTGTAPPYRRKPDKNFHEIIRLKAERRAEIERRCLDLEPPIRASTLTYMKAFNAAVQIPMPLNDNAWEALKIRLLAQRPEAEQKEVENVMEISSPDASLMLPSKAEHRPIAELDADQLWDEIKKTPLEKIKVYANDYISSIWAEGKSITKATASKFAADVLIHVRRRFYETIMEEDHAMEAKQIVLPPDSLPDGSRKLKLEDMSTKLDVANVFGSSQKLPKYLVPELLDHFQKTHLELDARSPPRAFGRPISTSTMDAPRMDWKFDMIELPHASVIRNLMDAPGMNLQKLQVIASVLPHYFPQPLPPIDPVPLKAREPSKKASAPPARLGSSTRYTERGRRSHMGTPSGIRDVEGSNISHGSGSRRRSPRRKVSGQSHSRAESPVVPFDGPPSPPLRASMLADDKHAARVVDYDLQPPPEASQLYPWHGYEAYRDSDPTSSQYHGYGRERAPFDRQYVPYEHVPMRYVEILPDGQQRIIEEIPAPFEPGEYIQPASEDYGGSSGSGRGGYYANMAGSRQRDTRYVADDGPSQSGPLRSSSPRNERHYQRRS